MKQCNSFVTDASRQLAIVRRGGGEYQLTLLRLNQCCDLIRHSHACANNFVSLTDNKLKDIHKNQLLQLLSDN